MTSGDTRLRGLCASMREGQCNEPITCRDASFTYCEECGAKRRAAGVRVRALRKNDLTAQSQKEEC